MGTAERIGLIIVAAGAALFAAPAVAQYNGGTVIIDGNGVRNDGGTAGITGSRSFVAPGNGAPARRALPFNTPRGPVLAGQDTSLPPRALSQQNRIVLRPPGQARRAVPKPVPVAKPAAATPAPLLKPAPQSVARAEPVRPTPKPAAAPEAPARVTAPAPAAPRPTAPARAAPKPVPPAATPAPATPKPAAVAPKPAPKAAPKPAQVAAVTPPSAAPGVSRILFDETSSDVSAEGAAELQRIAAANRDDQSVRLQVRAFAGSDDETETWERRTSLRRAQNVRRILLDNGIDSFRILVRALGDPGPDDGGPRNRVDVQIGR